MARSRATRGQGGAYCVLQCQQGCVVQDCEFDPLLTCSDTRGEFTGLNDDKSLPKSAGLCLLFCCL
ncbi:hypothetical protein DPMN_095236 [Dreissena polymorpha]|uniref:Uncharacterized protein n=1 Tax=Dreissena polymorpha TaxID=45954 RepID=A0A9D4R3L9_DREPO|nr:hypothetical protein DPMN_095236 [Dreissena polymorpha]